jgi:hypothetical protein
VKLDHVTILDDVISADLLAVELRAPPDPRKP